MWAAIATPEGWTTWAVPAAWWVEGEPDVLETSYDPADTPGSASTIRQRFLARIPGRLLAFRTIKAPAGFPHWDSYRLVTSVFELEPAGGRTRVRLTSTGYPDSEAGRELVAFFTRGNSETLEQLGARFAE
ncbi:Polyketide cyclase / dehydrase and lipid transport [compost metagenome]